MGKILLCVLFSFLFGVSVSANAKCEVYESEILNKEVRYCIHRTKPNQPYTKSELAIYFFHGMGGSSSSWKDNGFESALEEMKLGKADLPAASFVSFDTQWDSFFSDEGGQENTSQSYESWLIREFIPKMEEENGFCNERKCRSTMGLSMGGYGALKFALKYPHLFSTAAAHCPALAPFNIFESNEQWQSYFNRHPIGSTQGGMFLDRIRAVFPTALQFKKNDPIELVKNNYSKEMPMIYFEVGGKDYFGFQEGVSIFRKELKKQGIPFLDYYDPNQGHEIFIGRQKVSISFILRNSSF